MRQNVKRTKEGVMNLNTEFTKRAIGQHTLRASESSDSPSPSIPKFTSHISKTLQRRFSSLTDIVIHPATPIRSPILSLRHPCDCWLPAAERSCGMTDRLGARPPPAMLA